MNVCTDNPEFAREWFPLPPRWKSGLPENAPVECHRMVQNLLPQSTITVASVDVPAPWKYMVFVKHAPRSQFDTLVGMMRAGYDLPHGLVCIAGSGEGFHGLRRRVWLAWPGNMHLSLFFSFHHRLDEIATGLIALPAVSLVQTLDSIPGLERRAGVKWVNDILIDDSKLAGFLVHTQSSSGRITGALIGIGLNVHTIPPVQPTPFVPSVTALCAHTTDAHMCTFSFIFHRLLHSLAGNYQKLMNGRIPELLESYRERSCVVGRHVEIYTDMQNCAPARIADGPVTSIGDHLELILEGGKTVSQGRVVFVANSSQQQSGTTRVAKNVTPHHRIQQ